MYYRSLRSRVLLEYFIFKILFLLKIKKINKNKIISQKRFYYNSYILNCGNKVKTAIVTFDFVQNIRRKLQNVVNPIFGTNHPTNIRIVKNEDNDEKFLLSSNITHGFKNAELFATEGELDESQLYLFNNVNLLHLVDENNNVLIKNVQTALDQLNDDASKVVESISMKLKGNEELLGSLIIFQENVIKTRFSKNIISETSDNLVQSLEYMKNTKSYVKKDPFFIIKDVLENVDSSKID